MQDLLTDKAPKTNGEGENTKQDIEKLIDEVLNSNDTQEALGNVPDHLREVALGLTLEFTIISRDTQTTREYVQDLTKDLIYTPRTNALMELTGKRLSLLPVELPRNSASITHP